LNEPKIVSVTVECLGAESCVVQFEPEGSEHELRGGNVFLIELTGEGADALSLCIIPTG
jgi:hypothetical protein